MKNKKKSFYFEDYTESELVDSKSNLVKISINPEDIKDINQLVSKGNCKILDDDQKSMILELSGNEKTVEENIEILKRFKVLELLRSGKMAMVSGNQEKNKPVLTRSEP